MTRRRFFPIRNKKTAKRFLDKALKSIKPWVHPKTINADNALTFDPAIAELKEERKYPEDTARRQVKYLNNNVEANHDKRKRLINPVRGFESLKTPIQRSRGLESCACLRKDK